MEREKEGQVKKDEGRPDEGRRRAKEDRMKGEER